MLEQTNYNDALRREVVETISRIPIEYNPEGWEKLSKQLDAELPVNGGRNGSNMNGSWMRFFVLPVTALLVLSLTHGSQPTSGVRSKVNQVSPQTDSKEMILTDSESTTTNNDFNKKSEGMNETHLSNEATIKMDAQPLGNGKTIDEQAHSTSQVDTLSKQSKTGEEDSLFIFW